jgi:hypothetical protein
MQMVTMTIEDLHANVLAHMLQQLDGQSLAVVSRTTPGLRALIANPKSWHALCVFEWL